MAKEHVRHGFGTVRPYLYGAYELPGFLVDVFVAHGNTWWVATYLNSSTEQP